MADRPAPKTALPQHPTSRSARRLYLMGAVYLALGIGLLGTFGGATLPGVLSAMFGGLLVAAGVRLQRVGPAVMINNAAHDLLTQGRFDEAIALLDTIAPARRHGLVGIAVLSQRAYVLFAQGDAAGAVAVASEALALKLPLLARSQGQQYRLVLRANRALMLAAAGDAAEAHAEATRIDAAPETMSLLKGITALSRAVTFARAGDREALLGELTTSRALLEQLNGREAMLVRTLARLVAVPAGGAYRAPAARDGGELSAVARWIVTVVPQAASFAPRAAERTEGVDASRLPTATAAARARVAADHALAQKLAPNPKQWALLLLSVAMGMAIALPIVRHAAWPMLGPWAITVPLAALMIYLLRRNRGLERSSREARALYADGHVAESDAKLVQSSRASAHAHAALALLDLAEHAERRDDLPAALALVDRALGRLFKNNAVKASMSDILVPSLIALRARILAALDRTDESLAELEVLTEEYPTFPYATSAALLVRVLVALRLGDRDLARALARTRAPDTRLPRHGELLFDLLVGEAGWFEADGERERIEGDLAMYPGVRAWIERVAPGLAAPVAPSTGVRIFDLGGAADADVLAAVTDAPRGSTREA